MNGVVGYVKNGLSANSDIENLTNHLLTDLPKFIYGYLDGLLMIDVSSQLETCTAWMPEAERDFK